MKPINGANLSEDVENVTTVTRKVGPDGLTKDQRYYRK